MQSHKQTRNTYLDVFKFKHVAMDKGLLDLLAGPGDEQLVVVVGLTKQTKSCLSNHLHSNNYHAWVM